MTEANGNRAEYEPGHAARRGHVESWFVKINSPDGTRALWLKWTLLAAKGAPPRAECWAIVFRRGGNHAAFKHSVVIDAPLHRDPFRAVVGDAWFDGTRAVGAIERSASRLSWNVELEPRLLPLRALPFAWMYRAPFPETKFVSPIPDALARGSFVLDGETVDVGGWRGMQGHNWGSRHTFRYVWCHGSAFRDHDDVVFEAVSGRTLKFGVELPWMSLACLWIDGAWIRFDEPAAIVGAHSEAHVMRWDFATRSSAWTLAGSVRADRRDTVGLHYVNPTGPLTYCLNSKLAHLELTLDGPGGRRELVTEQAALELGWPTADHGIEMVA